jgi:spermidine synthase
VLLQWIGSIGSLALVAAVEVLVAAAYLRGAFPGRTLGRLAGAAVLLAVLAASALAAVAAPYCRIESRYFCLDEVDTTAWAGFPSRGLFMDGWVQSVEPEDGSDRLAIDAHAVLDAWVRRYHPESRDWTAFFIGGGGYSLPMRWVDHWPGFRATVAEIDPAVTAFAAELGFRRDHDRIRILDNDARAVLRGETAAVYDLVFSDAYSGHTMPAHLVSLEFHRLVRGVLSEDGVYAINVHDWRESMRFLAALVRTLERVFPEVGVWVSDDGPIRPRGRSHFMVLASAVPFAATPLVEPAPGDRVWSLLPAVPGRDRAPLLTDDYAPVDRLTQR